jgi:hypothetical protein
MINTFENIILSSAMGSRIGRGDAPVSTTTTTTTSTSTTTTTSTSTTCPPSTIVSEGLVLYNRCCSMSGSVWYDVSGNGNHALVSGSALVQSGSLGLAFNGTDNFLTYTASLTATPSSSWTMQWYGTFYNTGSNRDLFCKTDFEDGWDTIYGPLGQKLVFRDVGGQDRNYDVTNTPATKILYTMTVNSTTNQAFAYYNETFVSSSALSDIAVFSVSTGSLTFGFNANSDATYFKGTMSDIILYNRVLTPEEVTNNYNTLSTIDACF